MVALVQHCAELLQCASEVGAPRLCEHQKSFAPPAVSRPDLDILVRIRDGMTYGDYLFSEPSYRDVLTGPDCIATFEVGYRPRRARDISLVLDLCLQKPSEHCPAPSVGQSHQWTR